MSLYLLATNKRKLIDRAELSTSNISSISVPSAFDIEYSITQDFGPRMNEIEVYMTAITALEDLCFRDQSATIPGYPHVPFRSPSQWSLPQYRIYLEASSRQVRYAIWGIQLTAGGVRRGGFWPVIGRFFWEERFAGRVDFANKRHPLPPGDHVHLPPGNESELIRKSNAKATSIRSSSDLRNATTPVDVSDTGRLTIEPTFNGVPLSPRNVFGAAIDVMVFGAEYGPDTYCLRLQRAEVDIIGESDASGSALMKYKHLIRAMSILTSWMVRMDRFGEIDVRILRDGFLIGTVRIKKRIRSIADQ